MEVNPFDNSLIKPLEYDTDDEEDNTHLRILFRWEYEQNFDYFKLLFAEIYLNKNETFDSFLINLLEVKSLRISKHSVETGDVIKVKNEINFITDDIVYLYLIVYYDNVKCNFEYYGISDQLLEEQVLIENIKKEKKYGKNGVIKYDALSTNLDSNDFLVLCMKKIII